MSKHADMRADVERKAWREEKENKPRSIQEWCEGPHRFPLPNSSAVKAIEVMSQALENLARPVTRQMTESEKYLDEAVCSEARTALREASLHLGIAL